jgi:hypothetical protein
MTVPYGLNPRIEAARRTRKNNRLLVTAIGLFLLSLPLFLDRARPVYTDTHRTLAWALFALSTVPFFFAAARTRRTVPLMLLLSAQYAVFYALPVFFEEYINTRSGFTVPRASAIDMTLVCAILSLIAIGVGYSFAGKVFRIRYRMFHFKPSTNRVFWFGVVSLLGSAAVQIGQGTLLGWEPGSFSRPLNLVFSADLGVAILASQYYQGSLTFSRKVSAIALLSLATLVGIAGGMFQSAVQPLLIWVVCRWVIRGKTPFFTLALLACAFFVFQPVKGTYRKMVWLSGRSFSPAEKVALYGKLVKEQWLDSRGAGADVMEINRESAQRRLSMLMTTAHYVGWTPEPIDYKNGSTLGYLAYGWIPRAVWPSKPIAQEANKILPVEYNLQDITNQTVTMFGVGHVAEAYVNFGVLGIVPLFVFLGILYRIPQLLLERERTTVTLAIFVAVTVAMVPIGSSISNAFGGFLQQILVQGYLLRVLTRERPK